ncbi:MAG: hypothetical protein Q7O12_05225 [Deltaproteobacteria bacterium]|nr:hypothetical protein [Deltaproteobacteria bacterium]
MTTQRTTLWVALVSLALGATLLHYRIHTPGEAPTDLWPNLFSLIDLVLVSALFRFRSTALLGLLLNSFLAFFGVIMMADYSLSATLAGQMKVMPGADFFGWLLLTTFPDIMIVLADFLVGLALYRAILAEKKV